MKGLRYETVTWQANPADPNSIASALIPRRVPAGERINDPGTSSDDYLEVKISLSALSIFHPAIKVAIAIPQDRPPGVDHDAGKTCTCRTWDHDEIEPIAALPPCPPELPQTDPRYQERLHYRQINCDWIMGREVDFIDYPRPPEETWEGAGLHQYNDDLSSNSSFYYGSCTKIWHDRCDLLSAEEFLRFHEVTGLTNTDLTSHGCVGCLTEIWNEEDVVIDGRSWPNLLAVDIWSEYGSSILSDALQRAGYRELLLDGRYFEKACCVQRALGQLGNLDKNEAVDRVHELLGDYILPGIGQVNLSSLSRESGGIRLSEQRESVLVMIPPVHVYPGINDRLRPDGHPECTHVGAYGDLQGEALRISYRLGYGRHFDFPKVMDFYAKNLAMLQPYSQNGMGVACNHDVVCDSSQGAVDQNGDGLCNCDERGLGDLDGDGFCDGEDFCPDLFTGANCDIDGDGRGDGPRDMVERCMVEGDPPASLIGYGQILEAGRQFYCGGCDNCPTVFNPWAHTTAFNATYSFDHGIHPWFLPLFVDENGAPRLVEIPLPSRQFDLDYDGIGDYCDEDRDNDGIHKEHDCYELNPVVSFDIDGDGICDSRAETVGVCRGECANKGVLYPSFPVEVCKARCALDNCMEPLGSVCQAVLPCMTTEAAATEQACLAAGPCDFAPGPLWPYSSHGNRCVPQDNWCGRVFANHEQEDVDEDLNGDKCDWSNAGSPGLTKKGGLLVFGDGQYAPHPGGTFYNVRFRAWGGSASVVGGQLEHAPEMRDNTQVGACWCDLQDGSGHWHSTCYTTRCPMDSDKLINQEYTPWNPIGAPECNSWGYTGAPEDALDFSAHGICFNRELGFSRDEGTNFQELTWRWGLTRQVDPRTSPMVDGVIGDEYAASMAQTGKRTTRVRVAWPMLGVPINLLDPFNLEAAFTTNRALATQSILDLLPIPTLNLPDELRHFAVAPRLGFDPFGPVSRSGYLFSKDLATDSVTLLPLAGGIPDVSRLVATSFSIGIDTMAELAGTAGTLQHSLIEGASETEVTGLFIYQGPGSQSLLYVGREDDKSDSVRFRSSEEIFGTAAPDAHDPVLVFVADRQEVILMGSLVPDGPRDRLWRMRLSDGAWEGPFAPLALLGLGGYSAAYDPIGRSVLLAGGYLETLCEPGVSTHPCDSPVTHEESARVLALDVESMDVQPLGLVEPAPAEVARSGHGSSLDVGGRALYLVGGSRGTTVLGDSWKLDLRTRRWALVAANGPAMMQPFVSFDPERRTLWAGDYSGAALSDGLWLWGLPPQGTWQRTSAVVVESATHWPVDDTFVQGRTGQYLWRVDESQPLPGQYVLVSLETPEPSLGVSVRRWNESLGNPSELDSQGRQVAGMLCPIRAGCLLEVDLLPDSGQTSFVPYTLDVVPARPVLETLSNPGGIVEDLAVRDGKLFVAMGPWGLAVLEAATLAETSRLRGNGVGGASAIAWCGGRLCVARRGARGLSVVEPGWRRAPEVVAEHLTDHGSQDIAVSGGRIFLAHGSAGVGVYHLASPSALTHLETFQVPAPGSDGKGGGKQGGQKSGRIVSVAALEGRLLAAAQDSGKVYLYDLSAGRSLAAVIALPGVGQLERVRFRGGQLWALSAHPEQASIYDVSAPSSPLLLGQVTSGAAEEFRAQYVGARRYSFGSNLVSVYRMEVMTP